MTEASSTTETASQEKILDEDKEKLIIPIANNILNNVTLSAAFQVLRDQSIVAAKDKIKESSDEEILEMLKQFSEAESENSSPPDS
tara:strand:- start:14809 stop:15066 length:258 start_codon:yes stop_codon:yes gene_type:complete